MVSDIQQQTLFDYAQLDTETRIVVQQRTDEIRTLVRRTAQDIIEIGNKLIEVKARLGHGYFGEWLNAEFGWKWKTAQNFMSVADKFVNFTNINLAPSVLYLLSAPSVSDETREEAIALVESGNTLTVADTKQLIAVHRLPDNAPFYVSHAVQEGRIGVKQALAVCEALDAVNEDIRQACIDNGVTDAQAIQAWELAAKQNERFANESLRRGFVMDLDGNDIPLGNVDATLIRVGATESEYERLQRQQAHIAESVTRKVHVSNNSGENEWYTPSYIIDAAKEVMGSIDCDPASSDIANKTVQADTYYTIEDNGLLQVWHGNVWLNPPYSQPHIAQFVSAVTSKYASKEFSQACVLVNNATETTWFQELLQDSSAVCFFSKRIKFIDPEGLPSGAPLQGQALLYFGGKKLSFAQAFRDYGVILTHAR